MNWGDRKKNRWVELLQKTQFDPETRDESVRAKWEEREPE